jgi:voltage-gated potassium channel
MNRPLQPWLRAQLRLYLEDLDHPISQAVNLALTGLVLLSCVIFVAQTYDLPVPLQRVMEQGDRMILGLFTLEYVLRLWVAERRWRYVVSPYALVDLLAILPSVLGLSVGFLRVFRWFRVLRLVRFFEGRTVLGYLSRQDSAMFARILLTLFIIIFVFAGLIFQVEHPVNSAAFGTFLDAMYFAIATMTTVGFGDVTPQSQLGRLLTILMILTGITVIPWQVGDLVKRLVKTTNPRQIPCPTCGLETHEEDAHFCKHCGTALPTDAPVPATGPAAAPSQLKPGSA